MKQIISNLIVEWKTWLDGDLIGDLFFFFGCCGVLKNESKRWPGWHFFSLFLFTFPTPLLSFLHIFSYISYHVWNISSYLGRPKRCCLSGSSWKFGFIATSWSGKLYLLRFFLKFKRKKASFPSLLFSPLFFIFYRVILF